MDARSLMCEALVGKRVAAHYHIHLYRGTVEEASNLCGIYCDEDNDVMMTLKIRLDKGKRAVTREFNLDLVTVLD